MHPIPPLLLGLLLACATTPDAPAAAAKPQPNVVFILADDLGWRDVGCFGSTFHETPNIDQLAARGVRFTQAYAASPLCSPTRSSILTGQYPARTGITAPVCHVAAVQLQKRLQQGRNPSMKVVNADSLTRLGPEYFTLAEAFQEAGYATAHLGKWHLGHNRPGNPEDRYEPKDQGFGLDFPHTPNSAGPGGGYLAPWKFVRDPAITAPAGEHIDQRLAEEASRFIQANRERPFFLNFWAYSVHSPWNARADYIEYFKAKADGSNPQRNPLYAAMVRSFDDAVGRLMRGIQEAGVAERTIIVFFSDNGGWAFPPKSTDPAGYGDIPATSNLPLRSGKASVYEGGTREPCIVVWPGRAMPGTSSDALLSSVDWYPTLLSMCGLKPKTGLRLDGVDQTKAILGKRGPRNRVFSHFPHGSPRQAENIPGFLPATYVREGDWKLIRFHGENPDGTARHELYNLRTDPGESCDLAAAQPRRVSALGARITEFLDATDAVVPVSNPAYNPRAATAAVGESARPSADLLQGWKARECQVTVQDGVLRITGTGTKPFLGFAPGPIEAGSRLRFRLKCEGGQGSVAWLPTPGSDPASAPKPADYSLKAGQWAEIGAVIPTPGSKAGVVRLFLPTQTEPVELDWIELTSNGKTRRWDF